MTNTTLAWFSALNPNLRKKSTTFVAFDKLAQALPQVVDNSDRAALLDEIRQYTIDQQIDDLEVSGVFSDSNKDCRIDLNWWSYIFELKSHGELKY